MKKYISLSISQLEEARNHPTRIANKLMESKSFGPQKNIFSLLDKAIHVYQHDHNLNQALENYYSDTDPLCKDEFKTQTRDKFAESLKHYALLSSENGFARVGNQFNVDYAVIDSRLKLTGRVQPLLKDKNDVYVVMFLSSQKIHDWKNQLKYPFVQYYVQRRFEQPGLDRTFEICMFTCEDNRLESKRFSIEEMQATLKEIYQIGQRIVEFVDLQKVTQKRVEAVSSLRTLFSKTI